jgi:hypothetical protein
MLPSMPKVFLLDVLLTSFTTAIVATMPSAAIADNTELLGEKSIYLVEADGKEHKIGKAEFASENGGATAISVELDDSRFAEKFLSMRPFRCIDGTKQTVCHLPYPYPLKDRITADNLSDLEYRLLFLHKGPTDYGIDAWNGIYYKLSISNQGQVTGALHEADFNVLAAPPEKPFSRPIGTADLEEGEPGRHRFPKLIIR